jgi:STE24 endopeptidase
MAFLPCTIVLLLILARAVAEFWLSRLNLRHVRAHAKELPLAFRGMIDEATYRRSIGYTLAKSRFGEVVTLFDAVLLIALLFSGVLPWAFETVTAAFGISVWAMVAFLFAVWVLLSLARLPLNWYAQFKLEDRFGFNTTSVRTWIIDHVKGFVLTLLLGFPLLVLLLKIIEWTGSHWWIWVAAVVTAVQLVLMLIAPLVIMPLFNKFTHLPEGSLRDRLFALARRTDFPTRSIEVMDGSKRSRHSNAFFTGFGRFRKIVLFDTLVAQLAEPELESVVAHEIGHYKKRHILKLLWVSIFGVFIGFAAVAWLARQEWFFYAFGFEYHVAVAVSRAWEIVPAMLLFALLADTIGFWFSPLVHLWSRRFEYQADAFAHATMNDAQPLIQALRKLTEKNLSNLTPHRLFSGFYYSHPTLLERERALQRRPSRSTLEK